MKSTLKSFFVSIFVLLVSITIAQAEPLSFQGVKLEAHKVDILHVLDKAKIKPSCGSTYCRYDTMLKDIPVSVTLFFEPDDYLESILVSFKSSEYDRIRSLFMVKYGKFTSRSNDMVQNYFGATFENELLTWQSQHGVVVLGRFFGGLKEGGAVMSSKGYAEKLLDKRLKDLADPGF